METLPTKASAKGRTFTIADFYESGREELSLSIVAGGANLQRIMQRTVEEPIVNRPGLALTGFYEYFAWRRLQLVGKAEMAYLRSLDPETRRARFQALVDRRAFCFIFTNGQNPSAAEISLC